MSMISSIGTAMQKITISLVDFDRGIIIETIVLLVTLFT